MSHGDLKEDSSMKTIIYFFVYGLLIAHQGFAFDAEEYFRRHMPGLNIISAKSIQGKIEARSVTDAALKEAIRNEVKKELCEKKNTNEISINSGIAFVSVDGQLYSGGWMRMEDGSIQGDLFDNE